MSHLCLFLRVTKIMTFREIIGISLFFPRQENPVSSAGNFISLGREIQSFFTVGGGGGGGNLFPSLS